MKLPTLSILIIIGSLQPVFAAGFEVLAPHRAVYEVKMLDAEERSGINTMRGRIVYEVKGGACEGISIQYRFVTQIDNGRDVFVTDQRSASFESADGNEFSFSTNSFVNDQPDQEIKGSATRIGDGLKVVHDGKAPKTLNLSNGLFTSTHLLGVMESAQAGESFVSHEVFDGSADADQVMNTASVIGREKILTELFEGEGAIGNLPKLPAWPVTISYFNQNQDNTAESLPVYEASFLLYKNGVTRDLTMRYSDYSLKATLKELEFFDREACH